MTDGVFLACRRIVYTSKAKKRQININIFDGGMWASRPTSETFMFRRIYRDYHLLWASFL